MKNFSGNFYFAISSKNVFTSLFLVLFHFLQSICIKKQNNKQNTNIPEGISPTQSRPTANFSSYHLLMNERVRKRWKKKVNLWAQQWENENPCQFYSLALTVPCREECAVWHSPCYCNADSLKKKEFQKSGDNDNSLF